MRRNKGITLIALVITIIVLLILAGVAISMLSGENGILRKAAEAKTETEKKSLEERIKIAVMGALDDDLKVKKDKLKEELGIADEDIVEAGNNGYEVKVEGKTVYVSDDGKEIGELKEIDLILDEYFKSQNLPYKCRYGFVTGIGMEEEDTAVKLKNALKGKGYELRNIDNTNVVDDSDFAVTGMAITKDGDIVARVVLFGEINCNQVFEMRDAILTQQFADNTENNFEDYQIAAMDVNHDGIIDEDDAIEISKFMDGDKDSKVYNQNYYVSNIHFRNK